MTLQEIFNKVAIALVHQGVPSIDSLGDCMYRCGDLKCAAGHLILDEHYVEDIEGKPCCYESVQQALLLSGVPDDPMTEDFVSKLQKAHDRDADLAFPEEPWIKTWAREMENVASEYKLEIPVELLDLLKEGE